MRFNLFYAFLIIACLALIPFLRNRLQSPQEFFGIAETMSRNINYPYPVIVKKLRVQIGQNVHKGDTLVELERTDYQQRTIQLQYQLEDIQIRRNEKIGELTHVTRLYELELKELNDLHAKTLKELDLEYGKSEMSAHLFKNSQVNMDEYKDQLKQKMEFEKRLHNLKLHELKERYSNQRRAIQRDLASLANENAKIEQELLYLKSQSLSLIIQAPEDGIIGQIEGQAGDAIPAYNNILRIYGPHPTLVTSYIGDGHISHVKLGDSAIIQSLNDPTYRIRGVVTGLGSRITQFPDRIKKAPELRLWGREVQINIVPDNKFLQGEKVSVVFYGE